MPIPDWLKEHRELQMLRAAASTNPRPTRRKKKRTKVPKKYLYDRMGKLDGREN
jgi:hypothetical protein